MSRDLSPVEVTEAALARIEELNGTVNAVVTVNPRALDEARALELRGRQNAGLLYGLPVGIKDVTPVGGLRTTYESKLYSENVPKEDALVVQRLRKAGAIVIGKTNTPEFAAGGNTFNEVFGRTRNPWNLERSAGGSTGGGAAALATGMIALAEGTDLGGSLRIPASFCGVVGLRPSPGLVPTYPSDYVWDTLQVTGPMARTAEDVALMLQAMSGPSPLSPLSQPTGRDFVGAVEKGTRRGLRVAYCRDVAGIGIDDTIEAICRESVFGLKEAGVHVEEVQLDLSVGRPAFLALRGLWFVAQMWPHLDKIDQCGENVVNNVRAGLELSGKDLAEAEQVRGQIWHRLRRLLERYDNLVTPCMAVPPFPVERNYPETIAGEAMKTYVDWIAPTFVLSLTGLPVASVPCGLDGEGLPVGLQVVGPPQGEETVLALASRIQEAQPIGLPVVAASEVRSGS
ncbi:MAG: amidase family protein [Actinomycetota bacterium]|nr:amidase family protein [Actinomycetota bacterium]